MHLAQKIARTANSEPFAPPQPAAGDERPALEALQLGKLLTHLKKEQPAQDGHINLATALVERGYSCTLKDLKLSNEHAPLAGLDLSSLRFQRCEFDWHHLSESLLQQCDFEACRFQNVSFRNARLESSAFRDCEFHEAMLLNAVLSGVSFERCTLGASSFEDAQIRDGCVFLEVRLPGTHFLSAVVSDSRIERSDLTDTVFFGVEHGFTIDKESMDTAKLTRPTTATLVDPESRGVSVPLVSAKIAGLAAALPLRVATRAPTLDAGAVDAEVEHFLQGLPIAPGHGPQRNAHRLLAEADENPQTLPNVAQVMWKAKTLAEHVDSVVLPGGEDISPKLYGHVSAPQTKWSGDYRRSLLELALIQQCLHRGVPLMAICRGFQMTCVYFGADLHQHVGSQVGVRVLDGSISDQGLYGRTLQNIRAAVYHHQAVVDNEQGIPHLNVSLRQTLFDAVTGAGGWNAVMAVELSQPGAPVIGVQFHPEFFTAGSDVPQILSLDKKSPWALARAYVRLSSAAGGLRDPGDMLTSGIVDHLSPGNDVLWKILSDAASAHRTKRGVTSQRLVDQRAMLRPIAPRRVAR